jgi:hypothetical protein
MQIINGKITTIEEKTLGQHKKSVVTIEMPDRQKCYVEFRGPLMAALRLFDPGAKVQVAVYFEGKTAKLSGVKHNNIVAKAITNNEN